ncbi:nuclear transport factor 2 family protein [Fibrisoma limi]|nr:nuclear transport factor 2 family protein [Fibrisoma limi]
MLLLANMAAGQTSNAPTPERLVQQQIDAWNRHDAEAFAAPYSDTTRLYVFPDKLTQRFKSRQELQQYYAQFFAKNPGVHCEVISQLSVGNTVVLAEKVTGRSDGRVVNSIVTYKIEAGKIARVYFDYRP